MATYTAINVLKSEEFCKIAFAECFDHFAKKFGVQVEEIMTAYAAGAENVVNKVNEYVLAAAEELAKRMNEK